MNFLAHLLALDIAWFWALLNHNWFFLFAFAALAFYYAPKRWLSFFVVFTLTLWAWLDLITITGWAFLVAGFMCINYLMKVVLVGVVENSPIPQKYLILINELSATALWAWYAIFVLGGG